MRSAIASSASEQPRAASGPANARPAQARQEERPIDRSPARPRRGRLWRRVRAARWFVVGALALIALALGIVGYAQHPPSGADASPQSLLYYSLQLFTLQAQPLDEIPPPLNLARFLAPLVAAYTAVTAVAAIFSEQLAAGRIRLLRDQVVICGLGRKGWLLAQAFLERGQRVVAVELNPANPAVELCREQGGFVLVGDATVPETLRQAGVRQARHLIAVCGDDAANAEIAASAYGLTRDRPGAPLEVVAHMVNRELCSLLREGRIGWDPHDGYRLEFFNIYESGARAILRRYPPAESSAAGSRLVMIGLGELGENLVVQAAREWWLGRAVDQERLGITVLDPRARQRVAALAVRYPGLTESCDVEVVETDFNGPELQRAGFLFGPDGALRVRAVYVCLEDDGECLAAALLLQRRLHGQAIPIVAALGSDTSLARLLRAGSDGAASLSVFQLVDQTTTPELLLGGANETIARAIHGEWRRDQTARGQTRANNPLLVGWEELPEEVRESNRRQADHVGVKLRAVGCRIEPLSDWRATTFTFDDQQVERIAQLEHQRWFDDLTRDGWTCGPRDRQRKTHPLLLPWDALPEEARETNRAFARSLPAFLARAGFQIVQG